jgi:hypothetical protein
MWSSLNKKKGTWNGKLGDGEAPTNPPWTRTEIFLSMSFSRHESKSKICFVNDAI